MFIHLQDLSYLGIRFLKTKTKLQQVLKSVLNCWKLEGFPILFIISDLISGVVNKVQCGVYNDSYYGESIRGLYIRSGEHKGVPPFTGKKIKP